MSESETARSVRRAAQVLACFADGDPGTGVMGVAELARRTGLPVSTTHRLAAALVEAGLLERDPVQRRYRLGALAVELGQMTRHRRGLDRTLPALGRLAEITGATVDLGLRHGNEVLVVQGGSTSGAPGLRITLHATALGKALLAWDPTLTSVESLGELAGLTDQTITDPVELAAELEAVRRDGFAVNDEESAAGIRTIAVPVLDRSGTARYALAIRATPDVIALGRLQWFVAQARRCAEVIAHDLLEDAERPARRPVRRVAVRPVS